MRGSKIIASSPGSCWGSDNSRAAACTISSQPNHHSLSRPTNGDDKLSLGAPSKPIDTRLDRNCPPPTVRPGNIDHAATHNGTNAAAHRFDFRQFRHACKALNEPIPRSSGRYPHASEEPQRHFSRDVLSKELNCVDFTAYRAISSITPGNPALRASSIGGSLRRISGGRGKL